MLFECFSILDAPVHVFPSSVYELDKQTVMYLIDRLSLPFCGIRKYELHKCHLGHANDIHLPTMLLM